MHNSIDVNHRTQQLFWFPGPQTSNNFRLKTSLIVGTPSTYPSLLWILQNSFNFPNENVVLLHYSVITCANIQRMHIDHWHIVVLHLCRYSVVMLVHVSHCVWTSRRDKFTVVSWIWTTALSMPHYIRDQKYYFLQCGMEMFPISVMYLL